MSDKQEPRTWREFLMEHLRDPRERQRIASAVGVSEITLRRWVNNESVPRPQNLRLLLRAFPKDQKVLTDLLSAESVVPSLLHPDELHEDITLEPPAAFYSRVLYAYAHSLPALRTQAIFDLVFQQVLKHLDPGRLGMSVSVVQCVLPLHGTIVRSLRETMGMGTPPWPQDLEQRLLFLGAESLVGHAVTHQRSFSAQHPEEHPSLIPAQWVAYERSAAAAPITYEEKVAGCLLVSSTQPSYFFSTRQRLVECYADLIALAFSQEEFYPPDRINLRIMPSAETQSPYFTNVPGRVLEVMKQFARNQQPMSYPQAQQRVFQEIEEQLLQTPLSGELSLSS